MQLQPLLNIEATLYRIEKLLAVKQPRERKPKVELTDAQWLAKMVEMYPNYDVPQLLRDAEAHYVSQGKAFTRAMGAAWLRRQATFDRQVAVPGAGKKHGGLVL